MAKHGELAACIFLLTTLYWNSYHLHAHSLETFAEAEWPNHGGGIENRREARHEHKLSFHTLAKLKKKWRVNTSGDVTATPAIANGVIYFPTWSGDLYAVKQEDGKLVWRKNLTDLVGSNFGAIFSRHTPVVEKEYLLVGIYVPSLQLALNINTGDVIWSKLLDSNPYACITMSGSVYKGEYYIGLSSASEKVLEGPCCSFQGSMIKLDIKTSEIKWKTNMLPNNYGKVGLYSGAAIWGSSPPIDHKRKAVYIATGNLYTSPPNVVACEQRENNKTHRDVPDPCNNPNDLSESIVALDLDTGKVVWARRLGGYDTWSSACIQSGPLLPNCPPIVGPDYDFGEAPIMLTVKRHTIHVGIKDGEYIDIVVAGQKSGIVWALARDNGTLVWDAVTGPGSILGGSMWGAATDGQRVFTNVGNYFKKNFTLLPSNVVTTSGGWVSVNASSGQILWSIATPDGSIPLGPVSVANGLVFTVSLGSPNGKVYALDSKSGKVLWHYNITTSIIGGPSISNGCIYFGEGISAITLNAFPNATFGHAIDAICVT